MLFSVSPPAAYSTIFPALIFVTVLFNVTTNTPEPTGGTSATSVICVPGGISPVPVTKEIKSPTLGGAPPFCIVISIPL